ncbi:hypothetical protein ILUMI_02899 [Ignelater luminosus]|uniref:Uncharacterized protein n=1 Tax=Ignelater luminosus TaxID=2038154 RepID=A0A8K0DHD4_IGNLU|nr:hypothetical protein ILUMI_02899 [Ignelater luminosus]
MTLPPQAVLRDALKSNEDVKKEFDRNLKEIQETTNRVLVQLTRELKKGFEETKKGNNRSLKEAQEFAKKSLAQAAQELHREFEKAKRQATDQTRVEITEAIDSVRKQTERTLDRLKKVIDDAKKMHE